jgi:hypothetical protein
MLAITKQFASAGAIHSTTLYENSSRKSTTKGGRQRRYMVDPEIDLDNVKIPVPFKNGEPPLAPQDRNLLMVCIYEGNLYHSVQLFVG